jgi:hypothetical protein
MFYLIQVVLGLECSSALILVLPCKSAVHYTLFNICHKIVIKLCYMYYDLIFNEFFDSAPVDVRWF